jgi:hypothetical protein
MKHIKYRVLLLFLVLSGCQQGSNNSNENTQVNNICVTQPSACQPQVYQQNPGFQPYDHGQNGFHNGYPSNYYNGAYHTNNGSLLCNCPAGSVPTYNNYGGLGCVQLNYLQGSVNGYAYFGLSGSLGGATNRQWVNIPQISNYKGYDQSSCYNGVIQSCLVDQQSTCSQGYTCKATAAQSRLGLCISNTSNQDGSVYR